MKRIFAASFAIGFLGACASVTAPAPATTIETPAPTAWQSETFGVLTDYVGKRFKGSPTDESSEPMTDYQSWEWAFGGKAIRITHVLSGGGYGGETFVYPSAATGDLTYVYVTNSGFSTNGWIALNEDGSWSAEEEVEGQGDVERVRSTGKIQPDGTMTSASEYLVAGEWVPGHAFAYEQTDEPLPAFASPASR